MLIVASSAGPLFGLTQPVVDLDAPIKPSIFTSLLPVLNFLQGLLQLHTLDLAQAGITKTPRQLANHDLADLPNAFLNLAHFRL